MSVDEQMLAELKYQTLISHACLIAECMIFGIVLYFLVLFVQKQKNFIPIILLLVLSFLSVAQASDPNEPVVGIDLDGDTFSLQYKPAYDPSEHFSGFKNLTAVDESVNINLGGFGYNFGNISVSSNPVIPGFNINTYRDPFKMILRLFIVFFFVGRAWTTLRQY